MHPLVYFTALVCLTTLLAGFTRGHSILRPASLPIITIILWLCVSNCAPYLVRMPWASTLGGQAGSFYYQYLDVVLLSQFDYEAGGPTRDHGARYGKVIRKSRNTKGGVGSASTLERLRFGWQAMANWRGLGKPYAVRNVPKFSSSDPSYVPTRTRFLSRTACIIVSSLIAIDIFDNISDPVMTRKFYSNSNIPLFSRWSKVTSEELMMRIVGTAFSGIGIVTVQRAFYSVFAFVYVALNLSEPADWPPFFGPYSSIYSLRNLWSVFWHQTNTLKFSAISHWLVHDVLRLPRRGLLVRYTRAFATLFVSGTIHIVLDLSSGLSLSESGAMRFFCTQIVGILIEDVAVRVYKQYATQDWNSKDSDNGTRLKAWHRVIGAIWVIMFLSWSSPSYMYPMMKRTREGLDDSILPWSAIAWLRSSLQSHDR